jgi:hypothetical protein
LAVEVALAVLDDFPHGLWLVELGPVTNSALVAARVIASRSGERLCCFYKLAAATITALASDSGFYDGFVVHDLLAGDQLIQIRRVSRVGHISGLCNPYFLPW